MRNKLNSLKILEHLEQECVFLADDFALGVIVSSSIFLSSLVAIPESQVIHAQ